VLGMAPRKEKITQFSLNQKTFPAKAAVLQPYSHHLAHICREPFPSVVQDFITLKFPGSTRSGQQSLRRQAAMADGTHGHHGSASPAQRLPECHLPPSPTASAKHLAPSTKTLLPTHASDPSETQSLKPYLQSSTETAMPLAFSNGICQYNTFLNSTLWKQIYIFMSRIFQPLSVSRSTARAKSTTISKPDFKNPAFTLSPAKMRAKEQPTGCFRSVPSCWPRTEHKRGHPLLCWGTI